MEDTPKLTNPILWITQQKIEQVEVSSPSGDTWIGVRLIDPPWAGGANPKRYFRIAYADKDKGTDYFLDFISPKKKRLRLGPLEVVLGNFNLKSGIDIGYSAPTDYRIKRVFQDVNFLSADDAFIELQANHRMSPPQYYAD